MFKRVSYISALIVVSTAVIFADQIKEVLKNVPVLGEMITKNEA